MNQSRKRVHGEKDLRTSDARLQYINGLLFNITPNAQSIENARHVGSELDACADEAQIRGELIDLDVIEALLGQRQGAGQAAHTWGGRSAVWTHRGGKALRTGADYAYPQVLRW